VEGMILCGVYILCYLLHERLDLYMGAVTRGHHFVTIKVHVVLVYIDADARALVIPRWLTRRKVYIE